MPQDVVHSSVKPAEMIIKKLHECKSRSNPRSMREEEMERSYLAPSLLTDALVSEEQDDLDGELDDVQRELEADPVLLGDAHEVHKDMQHVGGDELVLDFSQEPLQGVGQVRKQQSALSAST